MATPTRAASSGSLSSTRLRILTCSLSCPDLARPTSPSLIAPDTEECCGGNANRHGATVHYSDTTTTYAFQRSVIHTDDAAPEHCDQPSSLASHYVWRPPGPHPTTSDSWSLKMAVGSATLYIAGCPDCADLRIWLSFVAAGLRAWLLTSTITMGHPAPTRRSALSDWLRAPLVDCTHGGRWRISDRLRIVAA